MKMYGYTCPPSELNQEVEIQLNQINFIIIRECGCRIGSSKGFSEIEKRIGTKGTYNLYVNGNEQTIYIMNR